MTDIYKDPEEQKTKTWITLSDDQLKGLKPISMISPQTEKTVIDTYNCAKKIEEMTDEEMKEFLY